MSAIEKIQIESYLKYLPIQYSDSPALRTLLSLYLAQVQQLEDANVEMNTVSTDIALAQGYQLDVIGKLVGAYRDNKTDQQLREAIYFRIAVNSGNGTPEGVIQYLSYVTAATKVRYWEHHPACIVLETNGVGAISPQLPVNVDRVTPAGVLVGAVISSETGEIFKGVDDPALQNNDNIEYDSILRGILPELGGVLPPEQRFFGFVGNQNADGFGSLLEGGAPFISLAELEAAQQTTKGVFADGYSLI